jgi:hypothetical protein
VRTTSGGAGGIAAQGQMYKLRRKEKIFIKETFQLVIDNVIAEPVLNTNHASSCDAYDIGVHGWFDLKH